MTNQPSMDDFESVSVFTEKTKDCLGSLTDTIPVGQGFQLLHIERFESEYKEQMNQYAIFTVKSGKTEGKYYTSAKALVSKCDSTNKDGESFLDMINKGWNPEVCLKKKKGDNFSYYVLEAYKVE